MSSQAQHGMLPRSTHDEETRQIFTKSLREHVTGTITAGNKVVYEGSAKKAFERNQGRAPTTRQEVRKVMIDEPYHQYWSAFMRTTQEMMWDSVGATVDRDFDDLHTRAKAHEHGKGSLRLDPSLPLPRYVTAVDIHCMPGNYTTDVVQDDVSAGALYDRGVYLYMMGGMGAYNESCGTALLGHIKSTYADFEPARILDMGCAVGHSTVPYVDAFPNAEIHAIDVGAPMVRYAHARAESLGKTVHFAQQNAERTDYPDQSFDLIVSHIALHETSSKAIRNIMAESRRLLRPGGMALHLEVPPFDDKDPFDQYLADWDTHYNAEPFVGTLHDIDLRKLMQDAGFGHNEVIMDMIPIHVSQDDGAGNYTHHVGGYLMAHGGKRTG
jgi:ubiquinone/menaquinone biosynthesis C-methylase UbiE